MDISFIIPAYNVARYIGKCLETIIGQREVHSLSYELIIVNDGSTDETLAVIAPIVERNNNIRVITQTNQGLSAARNAGLKIARGEYVWFIDSDDWISEEALHKVETKLIVNKPDVLLIRAANVLGDKLEERGKVFENADRLCTGRDVLIRRIWATCAPFYIFKRSFLEEQKLTFYTGIFHEDNEFTPRMLYRATKVALLNEVLYYVRQTPNSITRSTNYKKSFDLLKVADSLINFCRNEVKEANCRKCFMQFISLNINNALHGTVGMPAETLQTFQRQLKARPYYADCLLKSGIAKYVFEGVLFKLSSRYVSIYRWLQSVKG